MNVISAPRLALVAPPFRGRSLPVFRSGSPVATRAALLAGRQFLLAHRAAPGYLVARPGLTRDKAQAALKAHLHGGGDGATAARMADWLAERQLPGGGWSAEQDEPFCLSTSVLAYLAVKLHHGVASLGTLQQSRAAIRAAGGLAAVDAGARRWLHQFHQWPGDAPHAGAITPPVAHPSARRRGVPPTHGVQELIVAGGPAAGAAQGLLVHGAAELTTAARVVGALRMSGLAAGSPAMERATAGLIRQADRAGLGDCEGVSHALIALASLLRGGGDADDLPPQIGLAAIDSDDESPTPAPAPGVDRWTFGDRLARTLAESPPASTSGGGSESGFGATPIAVTAMADWSGRGGAHAEEIDRGAAAVCERQGADGGWLGPTGRGPVEATAEAVRALASAGIGRHRPCMLAGVNWLLAEQEADGWWSDGRAEGPASLQATAAAIEALSAAGFACEEGVGEAAEFLFQQQRDDGGWGVGASSLNTTAAVLSAVSKWAARPPAAPEARRPVCLRLATGGRVVG